MLYEQLMLQRTILSQRESQTDGLPVDSRALVTQIQSDSALLFLDEQCPVWEQRLLRL